MCQSATCKAGARRRTCVSHVRKAKSHGSKLAKSLLAVSTCFVVCNGSEKLLPHKLQLPSQCNIPVKATRRPPNNPVQVPPRQCNDPEERLYSAINQDEFLKDLRKLQARTKCTHKTCLNFIQLFAKYVGEDSVPKGFWNCDKKLKKAAGVDVIVLHGCTSCNRHVFLPTSTRTHCPNCGGARYNAKGKPNEVCLFDFAYLI